MSKYKSRQKPYSLSNLRELRKADCIHLTCKDFGQCILQANSLKRQNRPIINVIKSSFSLSSSIRRLNSLVLPSNEGSALNGDPNRSSEAKLASLIDQHESQRLHDHQLHQCLVENDLIH